MGDCSGFEQAPHRIEQLQLKKFFFSGSVKSANLLNNYVRALKNVGKQKTNENSVHGATRVLPRTMTSMAAMKTQYHNN